MPSYEQVRDYVLTFKEEPKMPEEREQVPRPRRDRQSPRSFARSIPAPAQLVQVDEHSMDLYVITPDRIPLTRRIHAAVLVCVKTAAIMSAVLALGPLKEEDYMRLVKGMLEPKDRLVVGAGWEHAVAETGVPRYLGSPDNLKLLLMKAVNRKTPGHGYRVHDGSRLSFQGRWYACPGLLNRLQGREFEVYYDRRVRHVGAC